LSRVEAALDGEVMLTEQAMIDGLDLLADLLRREHSCLGAAASITDYTSRVTYADRLPELVNVVCVKYETQTRVRVARVVCVFQFGIFVIVLLLRSHICLCQFMVAVWPTHSSETLEVMGSRPSFGDICDSFLESIPRLA